MTKKILKVASFISVILFMYSCSQQLVKQQVSMVNNPPITPKWIIGHVVWEDSINTQTAAQGLVQQYKEHNIPVSGIIIDSPWSLSYNDFNWDTSKYTEPLKMIESFKNDNVKVILWLTGCVNVTAEDVPIPKNPNLEYVIENNYAVNNGKISNWWKGDGVHLDFTNPNAKVWWDKQLDKVFVDGVYGWKVDQGELTFADSLSLTEENRYLAEDGYYYGDSIMTFKGRISMSEFKHSYYDHMFDYTISRNQAGITMARAYSHQGGLAASKNKLSIAWNGDFNGDYEGLKLQIYTIYKSAKEGFGAVGCEVGGFYGLRSNKSQLIRYAQFASLTAFMNNGGSNGAFTNHLPWYHDAQTTEIYRYYVTLHEQLSTYIFSTIVDAHLHGGSMIKNMDMDQYSHTVGADIFFKAITSDTSMITFNLPKDGSWIDFWTDEKYQGGSEVSKEYSLMQSPLFIKSGAIIPLEISNSITEIGNESYKNKTVVLIYPDGESKFLYHKPLGEGIEYTDINIKQNNGEISVEAESSDSYIFLIKTGSEPKEVTGADNWEYNLDKRYIEIEKTGMSFTVVFK